MIQLDLFEDGTAFAFNNNDTPLWYSPTGGLNWIPLPSPPTAGGTPRVDFSSPDLGYSLSGGTLFATTDKGLSWEEMGEVPLPDARESDFAVTHDLYAVPESDRVVVAGRGFYVRDGCPVEQTETLIWRSDDRGSSWETTRVKFPALAPEVEFLNDRVGVVLLLELEVIGRRACGNTSAGFRSSVQLTTDGGRHFREIYSALHADQDPVTAVAMPSKKRIVLGTADGGVLLSRDQGKSFEEVATLVNPLHEQAGTPAQFAIDAVTFGTEKVGYAGTNGAGTWRTADGGMTWSLETSHQSLFGLNIGDIAAAGSTEALASGPWAVARRIAP
ncbi:MAG: WD40/YVTN/BNR-like repeat-containing protein [Actinomycetota bacterium]